MSRIFELSCGRAMAWLALLCLPQAGLAGAAETNAPAPGSLDTFKIIFERNIFDPSGPHKPEVKPREVKVDAFALVGTMSYEKGDLAFFDGTSDVFKKAVHPGEKIGDYAVTAIGHSEVTLKSDTAEIELPMGKQLRREDDGDWKLMTMKGTFTPPSNPTPSATAMASTASGAQNVADLASEFPDLSEKQLRKLSRISEGDVKPGKDFKEFKDYKDLKGLKDELGGRMVKKLEKRSAVRNQ